MQSKLDAPPCAAPDRHPAVPRRRPPARACDTHVHICGPESRFPYVEERIYTPPDALLSDYLPVAETLGLERVVFVQPSVYGTDNSAMLDAMARCPLENRGVAVVDPTVSEEMLDGLRRGGIRGARLNLVDVREARRTLPVRTIRDLAERIAPLGWHLELLIHVDDSPDLDVILGGLPVDVVVGHLGYARPGRTKDDPGFRALLRLMQRGRCWAKLTGPYRLAAEELPYPSAEPFARSLLAEAPERLLWGSDWPHVMVEGVMPNDGNLLELVFDWVPQTDLRQRILVDNPAELYGF
jgi:predicted TIM-barrel fold metal-dependent hydrolase